METKYYDELFGCIENGEVVVSSWVYEDGTWGYRKLMPEEIKRVLGLLTIDNNKR